MFTRARGVNGAELIDRQVYRCLLDGSVGVPDDAKYCQREPMA
jgi:hypothetical protein